MEHFEQIIPSAGNRLKWEPAIPFSDTGGLPANCHPVIRAGAEYWHSIKPETVLPGSQHLDLDGIPGLHPHLRLVDVVGAPPRFQIRQTGAHVAYFLGATRPGAWFDETFENFHNSHTYRSFVDTIDSRRPNWRRGKCELGCDDKFTPVERIQLPFASDGENVDMIMVCIVFGISVLKVT